MTSAASYTLSTAFNGPATFARASDDRVIICNGYNQPLIWKPTTQSVKPAGMPATGSPPICVPGGAEDSGIYGTYWFYSRYVDADGHPSCLSPATRIDWPWPAAGHPVKAEVDVVVAGTSNTRATHIEIWRTTAGQNNTVYRDHVFNTASSGVYYWTATRSDCALKTCLSLRILTEDGRPNANRFVPPPDDMPIVVSFKDRVWFFGKGAAIYWSELGEPESVPEFNCAYIQDESEGVIGGIVAHGFLYLFTRHRTYRLSTNGVPHTDISIQKVSDRGALNHRCCVAVDSRLVFMDEYGVWAFDGQSDSPLSTQVTDAWWKRVNWSTGGYEYQALKGWVGHSPDDETLMFWVCLDGNTTTKHAICYQYRTSQWWLAEYHNAFTAGGLMRIGGQQRLVAGEVRLELLGAGVLDGPCDSRIYRTDSTAWSGVRGVISSASQTGSYGWVSNTSTTLTFTSTLSTNRVVGSQVYVEGVGGVQNAQITSYSGHRINYYGALSPAPQPGDTYQVGGIHWRIKLGTFRYLETEHTTPRRLHIHFKPISSGTMYVRLYPDYSATPVAAVIPFDDQNGVKIEAGATAWRVDLSTSLGYALINLDDGYELRSPATRCFDLYLEGVQPTELIQIYGIDIDGVIPSS